MPDDDDRDDTTTAQAPVPGRLPESEEEVPTKVTNFSAAEIAKIDAEYEAQRKKAADQIDTASIVLPIVPTPSKPPSGKSPVALPVPHHVPTPAPVPRAPPIRPAAGSPANSPGSAPALPESARSESDEEDDSIVTIQVRPEDPADDSIVTVQKPVPSPPSSQPQKSLPSSPAPLVQPTLQSPVPIPVPAPVKPPASVRIPIMPVTQASPMAPTVPVIPKIAPPAPTPPPRKKSDDDIYDAEEDRTERRDLPFEEIERAVSRAKLDSVSITEFPDDSPTARRRVPGPYSHLPVETIASPTIKSARESSTNEVDTTTDMSPTAKRVAQDVLGDALPRMPLASDSDVIATERRQRENIDPQALAESPAITAAIERAPNSPRPAPVTTPIPLQSNKPTMRFGATMPIPQTSAAAQNAPLRGSDPSIAAPFESSPRLQAVIPLVLPSSGNIPVATAVGTIPPGSAQAHNMPSSGMHASAPPASMGGINATMPSAQMQGTPAPPQVSRSTGSLQPGSMQPGSMQQPSMQPPGFPTTYTGSRRVEIPAETQSEPRWIVLVLVVLAICMLIPALLYVALRPREESDSGAPIPSAVPAIPVRPLMTSKPVDVGQAPSTRRR